MISINNFLGITCAIAIAIAVWKSRSISLAAENFLAASTSQTQQRTLLTATKEAEPNDTTEVNILDWFTDTKEEVIQAIALDLENGRDIIPTYLKGNLVRNGPTLWRAGNEYYGHLFDGAAKVTKFAIDGHSQSIKFSSRLVASEVLDSILEEDELKPAASVGPILSQEDNTPVIGGPLQISASLFNAFFTYDNCVVNVWDYDPLTTKSGSNNERGAGRSVWLTTDTVSTARVDLDTLETMERGRPPKCATGAGGFEFLLAAHPEYDKTGTGATYNVNGEITLTGIRLNLVKETDALAKRTVIASLTNFHDSPLPFVGGLPYVHSFGLTETRALILVNPVRLPVFDIPGLLQKGFLRASTESEHTLLWVVELASGKSKTVKVPEPIFYYHTVSATDEPDGVHSSIRVMGKSDSSYIIGDNHFLRMDQVGSAVGRNRIAKQGNIVEIRTDGESTATVKWFSSNKVAGFEYPTHRYARVTNGVGPWQSFQHPRYVYGAAGFCGSEFFDRWCLVKVDTASTTTTDGSSSLPTLLHREPSQYYSEPIFVPDPDGKMEDDGVVLSHVYDGVRRESYLLILNARNMEPLAKAYTGVRNTVDFHGAFFQ